MNTNDHDYLTSEQVYELNEKHGWFQFGDAQGTVSRAFAQDAIAMHEHVRAAAPLMLEALTTYDQGYEALRADIINRAGAFEDIVDDVWINQILDHLDTAFRLPSEQAAAAFKAAQGDN